MDDRLTPEEQLVLLRLAREAIQDGVCGLPLVPLSLEGFSPRLRELRASFVTLSQNGRLRGCVGGLEPCLPLAEDVRAHALAAALEDYRFPPVQPDELPCLQIEVSCLTLPRLLDYACPEDLLTLLQPGRDGVVLQDGLLRATFLPQVWEKVSEPGRFLGHLCLKMGAEQDYWQKKRLQIYTYQIEEFHD